MADDGSPVNARSKGNSAMLETAFLYGGSAQWIEQMQAAGTATAASCVPTEPREAAPERGSGNGGC